MSYFNFIAYIIAYLLGSIPFGLLFSKCFLGLDIRSIGSGNIGATNVYRTGNKLLAIFTLIMDGLKGVAAIYVAKLMGFSYQEMINSGFLCVIGHMFPVWLKFRGGKGVATTIAVVLTLTPFTGLMVILMWLVTFFYRRISSLASVVAATFLPILTAIIDYSLGTIIIYFIISLLILFKHQDNIKRLSSGKENRI